MKRYTFFTDDYPVVTCDHCYEDQNENYCGPAIERLAEYEATGLMPAEVAGLQYQLRAAKDAHRWIPVAERLPERGQTVLVFVRYLFDEEGRMEVEHYNPEMYESFWGCVTHWMPLPQPPKEVE